MSGINETCSSYELQGRDTNKSNDNTQYSDQSNGASSALPTRPVHGLKNHGPARCRLGPARLQPAC